MKNRTGLKPKQEETCNGATQIADRLAAKLKRMGPTDPKRSGVQDAVRILRAAAQAAKGTQLTVAHKVPITVGNLRNQVSSVYSRICSALEIDA